MGRSDTTPTPGQAEGLLEVGPDGRVRAANAEMRRLLGRYDEWDGGPAGGRSRSLVGAAVGAALADLRDPRGRRLSDGDVPGVSTLTEGGTEPWRLLQVVAACSTDVLGEPDVRWVLAAAAPRADGTGAVQVSLLDVTATTEAQAGGRPGPGGEAVLISDASGVFTYASGAAQQLIGYRRDDLVGRCWRELLHAADRELVTITHDELFGGAPEADRRGADAFSGASAADADPLVVRVRFRHASGHHLWLECMNRPVLAGSSTTVAGLRTTLRDVTVEVEMEIRQEEAERQLALTLDHAPIGMALVALDGTFLRVNQALCGIVGYRADELMRLSFQEITHPEDLDADLSLLAQLVSGEIGEYALDKRYVHRDGRTVWARLSMTLLCDDEDEPLHYISQVEDITERRDVLEQIAESERRYRLLAENAGDIISRLGVEGTLLWLSPAVERMLGHPAEALIGTPIAELCHPLDRAGLFAGLREVRDGRAATVTHRTRARDGRWIWLESRLHAVLDEVGDVAELQAVSRDVTDRQQARAELERLALTDPLTGLANRALLFNHLAAALARMRRTGGLVALMLLDLDRFKEINDTLGHPVGDELICQAAARLRAMARPSDTVARLGGDEMVVLVDGLPDAGSAQIVADRILGSLREPYALSFATQSMTVSASMGIALASDPDQPVDDLYRQADLALYRAKDAGRDRWAFFESGLEQQVRQRLDVHRSLRQAVDAGSLAVLYQPVVDLVDGSVSGAEALVRVRDPAGRLISPDRWLDVAAETGLLGRIDAWVLQAAAAQAASWTASAASPFGGGGPHGPAHIAINVSAGAFTDPRYCDALLASIRANGLAPEALRVELTEHSLLHNTTASRRALYRLASMGVGLGIDDIGTGYSSLSYLHQLPISFVKIDRSFIGSMTTDPRRHEVVRAVIDLVHGLGHTVVAEGVETEQQLHALQALGCDSAQGFLFGRPVPADEFDVHAPLALLSS